MSTSYIPDNYDIWSAYDREQCRASERLPRCSECGDPITDETALHLHGECICDRCVEENTRPVPED